MVDPAAAGVYSLQGSDTSGTPVVGVLVEQAVLAGAPARLISTEPMPIWASTCAIIQNK